MWLSEGAGGFCLLSGAHGLVWPRSRSLLCYVTRLWHGSSCAHDSGKVVDRRRSLPDPTNSIRSSSRIVLYFNPSTWQHAIVRSHLPLLACFPSFDTSELDCASPRIKAACQRFLWQRRRHRVMHELWRRGQESNRSWASLFTPHRQRIPSILHICGHVGEATVTFESC